MKTTSVLKVVSVFCLTAVAALANVITGVTGNATTPSPFTILGVSNENQKANEMGGLLVTATFGDSSTVSCTFANDANSCTDAGANFSFTVTPGTQNTSAATWEIRNLRAGTVGTSDNLISLSIDGSNAGNGGPGLATIFNPCVDSAGPPIVFDGSGGCSGVGTGNGQTIQSHSGGLTGVTASVLYDRVVMLSTESVPGGQMWFRATLTFAGTTFEGQGPTGGVAFLFDADTDQIDIPEPSTYGIVGLSLLGLGALRRRKT